MEGIFINDQQSSLGGFCLFTISKMLKVKSGRVTFVGDVKPAPMFVSFYKGVKLRGCIGTSKIKSDNFYADLEYFAVQAAFNDPRFPPITEKEITSLRCTVDVIHTIEEVDSLNWKIGTHGIFTDYALYLPSVAEEQEWTREETLKNLALKGGVTKIPEKVFRFQTVRGKS